MHCSKTFETPPPKQNKTKNKLKTKTNKETKKQKKIPQAAFFPHGYFPNADLMEGRLSLPALSCGYSSTVWSVKNKF